MNYSLNRLFLVSISLLIMLMSLPALAKQQEKRPWISAYYAIWQQRAGRLTPAQIDYAAFSHLIHFAILPGPDGSVDQTATENITDKESAAVLGPAHAAGRKVLVCVGGADSAPRFRPALSDENRAKFVRSLVQFVTERGYDGLDVDMEPIETADLPAYRQFIVALRKGLRAVNPRLLLTAATGSQPALFAGLQTEFDQINLMTYDLSGPWEGWQTWHNAALTNTSRKLQSTGALFPSVSGMAKTFLDSGIAPGKLGIGIDFYGDVWQGASAPEQAITGVTCTPLDSAAILDTYERPGRYHWDSQAQAPYLSVDAALPKERFFVSYDDERLCALKVRYVREHQLGGAIIWELSGGYRASQPPGKRDTLLQAVKRAWLAKL